MSNTTAPPANAAISVRTTLANSKWLNATSPKSGNQIAVGDQVVLCPKCYTPQLLQDWRDNDNKCGVDGTPARVIERATRAAGDGAAAASAAASTATPAAAPPAAAARPAPAAGAGVAPMAVAGATNAPNVMVDPYRYARVVEAAPVSDVWRRNIMFMFWMLFVWGVIVGLVWVFQLGPTAI